MERSSVIAAVVGCLALLVAGCDSSEPPAATVTATVTATTTVAASPEVEESSPASTTAILAELMGNEYPATTLRRLARTICQELRTGERDRSFPWRQMIGYIGEKDTQAFVAHSVAAYCPEQGPSLVDAR